MKEWNEMDKEYMDEREAILSLNKHAHVFVRKDGYVVNREKIKQFVATVERISIEGYIDLIYEQINILKPEENIRSLATCIREFFLRSQKKG